jgi:molecular chaperone Hsp33
MTDQRINDHTVRAMTAQNGFRAVAIRSTDMVRRAVQTQQASSEVARMYAELLTGAVLIRETMAPKLRVQTILKRVAGGSMVADAHPGGMTRGLVNLRGASKITLGAETNLQVIRELPNGELHQGVVATTAEHGLSASLTTYMIRSEQVETAIAVGCNMDGDDVVAAGGYIIQHMPDADHVLLAAITARLEQLDSPEVLIEQTGADPRTMLDQVLDGIDFDVLQEDDVRFGCNCSRERFLSSLATLGRDDLEQLVEDDEPLEITCDYCAEQYRISTIRVRSLLDAV